MSWKHSVWRSVAALASLAGRRAPAGLRVLCYHSVGEPLPGDPYGLALPAAAFRRQMELVASGRFGRPTTLGAARLDGTPELAVTFDDGFRDTLTAAAPVLASLSLPFTVAATSSFILGGKAPHLDAAGLRELARVPGAEIGAHGAGHLRLAEAPDAALAADLAESRARLEDLLGAPVTSMTWPHGSASRRTAEAARRAGFLRAGCSLYGVNEPGRDPLLLKRTEIVGFDSDADFAAKASGAWDFFALRQGDPAAA